VTKQAKGDLDGAIADYTRAIELEGTNYIAYNNRGMAKQAKGDLDGAILDLTKAIELKPDYAPNYINRGFVKQTKFDFDGAIVDFNKANELKPGDNNIQNMLWFAKDESTKSRPVLFLRRGMAKKDAGSDWDGAIAEYNKAIELKPDFAEAYFSRGYAKKEKGDLGGAIVDYTKAIELKPDFARAYNNRGWCEFLKNDFDSAVNDANRAIQLNSTNRSFYDTRGWARYEKGDVVGALDDCNRAVGLSQVGTWAAVETQGLVNFINGDYHMAFEQWNNTFQHDTNKQYLLPFIEKAKAKQALPR
jgi:tetratricopeptide (TPR) repeat protein